MNARLLIHYFFFFWRKTAFFLPLCAIGLLTGCNKLVSELANIDGESKLAFAAPLPGYTLVWEDNFDTPVLDVESWRYRTDCKSESCQRPENVEVADGNLKILLKKETYNNRPFTGGGIITKAPFSYGYYEVRAKMNNGYGWHEAFWAAGRSGFDDPNPPFTDEFGNRLEIDCFESPGNRSNSFFHYGAINWSEYTGPLGGGSRDAGIDLSTDYHIYGFEYTPDFINFYFDGELLRTTDIRLAPQHNIYLWLTCIATQADATDNGVMYVDYIRAYETTATEYDVRKVPFLQRLDSIRGPQHSDGTDLWIEAEDFVDVSNWSIIRDIENTLMIQGFQSADASRDSTDLTAITGIVVSEPGTYTLWVRSRDFDTQQGRRKFKIMINEEESAVEFGTHGEVGYGWQSGGTFSLNAGTTVLKLYDSSQYFARCDKMLLTTDASFVPNGVGGISNVQHVVP